MNPQLERLYAQVPELADCRGLCADSCKSPFEVAEVERREIESGTPVRLVPGDGVRACSMLVDGRCSVYERRPMVCRLFATAPMFRCQHGCRPVRWLPDARALRLLVAAHQVGGEALSLGTPAQVERMVRDAPPGAIQAVRAYLIGRS